MMTSEPTQKKELSEKEPTEGTSATLIEFDENKVATTGNDINNKISSLNVDLEQLRAELLSINKSVDEGMDRLSDTDTDLTAKVSETYKRLGEIDNAYKALIAISSRIDTDIQKLNGNVSEVAVQSAEGLKNLEQTSISQSNEFTQKNQKVVSKVNELVETSKLTSEILKQKIQHTTENMLQIEQNVLAEVERLSETTDSKTEAIEQSLENNKAKIIKLQSVDEAIIRRATTLEISSAELSAKSQNIEDSVGSLQESTKELSSGLDLLKERTLALEVLTEKHSGFIGGLQKKTEDISEKLHILTGRESRHFNMFSSGFLLLLAVTAVIYFSQQSQFDANEVVTNERTTVVDNQIANLQQVQATDKVITSNSLADLEAKIEKLSTEVKEDVVAEIDAVETKIVTMSDQVQSVEGRLNQSSPFSSIGNDNMIHSESWITQLPAENLIVQLAVVDNKDAMFEIADRNNFYLKDSLSYFEVADGQNSRYVLMSGNYSSPAMAQKAISDIPVYIDMQRPVLRKVSDVQDYITKH